MELQNIPIDNLAPNPFHLRQSLDREKLLNLSASLRKYGVLTPLLVAQTPAGLQIVAGERRWRAAKMAGLKEVPCIILKNLKPADLAILSLTENLQSEPLSPFDQAGVFLKLKEEHQLSDYEIAKHLGLEENEVTEILGLLEVSDQIKVSFLKKEINQEGLMKLAKIKDPVERLEEFNNLRELQNQHL